MTKDEYDKISVMCGIYEQWHRMKPRLRLFNDEIKNYFNNLNVIEIGCNAGLYAYEIAPKAKTYLGIEKSKMYYKQSLETLKHIKTKNVTFINKSASQYMKYNSFENIDIFMSFNVLYHLEDKELWLLKNKVLSACTMSIIQIRKEGKKVKKNKLKLHTIDGVLDYLGRPKSNIYTMGNYSIIVSFYDNKRKFDKIKAS